MNTLKKIQKAFNPPNDTLFLDNVYTPPRGSKGLQVAKTVTTGKATFNEVFTNVKKQLL